MFVFIQPVSRNVVCIVSHRYLSRTVCLHAHTQCSVKLPVLFWKYLLFCFLPLRVSMHLSRCYLSLQVISLHHCACVSELCDLWPSGGAQRPRDGRSGRWTNGNREPDKLIRYRCCIWVHFYSHTCKVACISASTLTTCHTLTILQ